MVATWRPAIGDVDLQHVREGATSLERIQPVSASDVKQRVPNAVSVYDDDFTRIDNAETLRQHAAVDDEGFPRAALRGCLIRIHKDWRCVKV